MKTLLSIAAFTVLAVASAHADDITITLDNPVQSGGPGQTLDFFGTIQNLDNAFVYMDYTQYNLQLNGASYTITDDLVANTPYPLDPAPGAGSSSGDVELFSITLNNPLADPLGIYQGTYTIVGGVGADGNDNLGQADFTIVLTPEPAAFALFGTALALILVLYRGRARQSQAV